MNKLDKDYQALLKDILDNGKIKGDRTGTGTLSVFGRQIRHDMSTGFPLLTTKKMPFKNIVTELLWFLRGETNIKYLLDNKCHIWDGDTYKHYTSKCSENSSEWNEWMRVNEDNSLSMFTMNEFIEKIKTDDNFAIKWGDLGPIYGKQWRNWETQWVDEHYGFTINKIDQIQALINDIKTNPDDRGLIVSAWNVGDLKKMVLRPCHNFFQIYTRELSLFEKTTLYCIKMGYHSWKERVLGTIEINEEEYLEKEFVEHKIPQRAISLMWNQRSVDTFLGLPFNIASYAILLQIIADEVNMVPDELIGNLGDVHLYSNHLDQAKEQIERTGYLLPTLRINTEFWNPEKVLGDNFGAVIKGIEINDFSIDNYISHPPIKADLSN